MEKEFIKTLDTHKGIIYRVCKLYCPANDCDDLYQDIVAQLWQSWNSFRGEAKITTWIYRVALNTAISGFRKKSRRPVNHEINGEALNLAQENLSQNKEDIELLQLAIKQLSDPEKAMVMLYLEPVPYEEIAAVMGISQNNVRVKMLRIREKLRNILIKY